MSKLVIIGAIKTGTSQSLVTAALRRGLAVTIVTAHNDPLVGIFPSQVEIVASDLDPDTLVAYLSRDPHLHEGRMRVTTANNRYARVAARTAASLGLPGPDADCIDRSVSKQAQKRILQRAGVPTPRFVACRFSDWSDVSLQVKSLRWPVVVKPEEGSESFGVRLCQTFEEATAHAADLRSQLEHDPKAGLFDRLVVEEYLLGAEYCIELFDGACVGILRKIKRHGAGFIERGYTSELDLDDATMEALAFTAQRAGRAAGLTWGPVHFDCIVHDGVPQIIEINARIAGSFICNLIADAYGFDLVSALLDRLLGQSVHLPVLGRPRSYARVDFILDDDPRGWHFDSTGECETGQFLMSYGPQVVNHRERQAFIYVRAKPPVQNSGAHF